MSECVKAVLAEHVRNERKILSAHTLLCRKKFGNERIHFVWTLEHKTFDGKIANLSYSRLIVLARQQITIAINRCYSVCPQLSGKGLPN